MNQPIRELTWTERRAIFHGDGPLAEQEPYRSARTAAGSAGAPAAEKRVKTGCTADRCRQPVAYVLSAWAADRPRVQLRRCENDVVALYSTLLVIGYTSVLTERVDA
jgi:hypothetical protein